MPVRHTGVERVMGDVQAKEPTTFEAVKRFLIRAYRKARSGQDIIFCGESYRSTSELLDGPGGAAFLLEFLHVMGGKLVQQREFLKRMIVAAAWSLKLPIVVQPSGIVSLHLAPKGEAPKIASWLERLSRRALPFPPEVQAHVLSFAGQIWFSQKQGLDRNLASFSASYAIECGDAKVRRRLKAALPFKHAVLSFSDMNKVFVEWSADSQLVWAAGGNLWPLITLLRTQRRTRTGAAVPLKIRGFGMVLI